VELYDEFNESLKELVSRNTRFLKNEIEITKIINQAKVMTKELD
jgi:hypothetical protein